MFRLIAPEWCPTGLGSGILKTCSVPEQVLCGSGLWMWAVDHNQKGPGLVLETELNNYSVSLMPKTNSSLLRWRKLLAMNSWGNVSMLGFQIFSFLIKFCNLHGPTSTNSPLGLYVRSITSVTHEGFMERCSKLAPRSGFKAFIFINCTFLCLLWV